MNWRFSGESFSWQIDGAGEMTFQLEASWHAPIPDMGGPAPELNLEEIENLFGRTLQIRYSVGDSSSILRKAQELARMTGSVVEMPEFSARCMLWLFEDIAPVAELSVHVPKPVHEALLRSFQAYATMSGAKCFGGNLNGHLLFGPQIRRATLDQWAEFLRGDRPALLEEPPHLTFTFGQSLPKRMSWNDLLQELKGQF